MGEDLLLKAEYFRELSNKQVILRIQQAGIGLLTQKTLLHFSLIFLT